MYDDLLGKPKKGFVKQPAKWIIPLTIKLANGQAIFENGLIINQDVLEEALHEQTITANGLIIQEKYTQGTIDPKLVIGTATGYKIVPVKNIGISGTTGIDKAIIMYVNLFLGHEHKASRIESFYTMGVGNIDTNKTIQKGYKLLYLYAKWKP